MASILSTPVQGGGTPYGTLGRLPIELRNEIYTHIMGKCWNLCRAEPDEISQDFGIMAVSKSISWEAQEVFYAEIVFMVKYHELFYQNTIFENRLVHAPRIRCLELRLCANNDTYDDIFSPMTSQCFISDDFSSTWPPLASLLVRGHIDQELRLLVEFQSWGRPSDDARFEGHLFNVIIPYSEMLRHSRKVVLEWLHQRKQYEGEEEYRVPGTCPYFKEVNQRLQGLLGPSRMEIGHDDPFSFRGTLNFRPRDHWAAHD